MTKKIFSVMLALAFVFGAALPAKAQSVAELQAMIAQLQLQIAALMGVQTGYNYTFDLTIGSTGPAVVALQTELVSKGFLVMPVGVSKGYFGPITQSALARYQASVGINPPAGYFGPITRAHFNAMVVTPNPTPNPTPTPTPGLSGGEASLEDFAFDSEDDAEEGEMTHVGTIEFDVEDGDVQINRIDVSFEFAGGVTADDEPWDAFETITLMIDGDEVAEKDIDDENDWLRDNEPYIVRLSNINYIVDEGDTVEIEIYLTAQNNVDGAGTDASWTIYIADDGIRAVDSVGIQNYIGDDNETVTFDIDEEGGDEDIEIRSSSSNPDAMTLLVDEDSDSEWHEVFIFRLDAEDNDIDIDELVLEIETGTATYNSVVRDVIVEIDGEEFDDFDVTNGGTTTATLTFDINGDATVDGDESVDVVVMIEFRRTTGNYNVGETVQVRTVSVAGDGADDVDDTATVSSRTHTLDTAVASISNVTSEVAADDPNDSGVISFEFTVDAEEGDVTFAVANNTNVNGTTDGVKFDVTGTDPSIASAQLTKVSGDATYAAGVWTINEGDDATFVLDVSFTTVDAGDNGVYRVNLDSVAGTTVDKTSNGLSLSN